MDVRACCFSFKVYRNSPMQDFLARNAMLPLFYYAEVHGTYCLKTHAHV